jgi:hypothetical protein
VYRLDRQERWPPASVRDAARRVPALAPLVAGESPRARVYGRAVRDGAGRTYLQYWTFYEDNPQDRGIVRTGRHEGDWELVQVRLAADGRPDSATYLQHSWAERCGWDRVEREGPAPVVYVGNASHAAYFTAGVHGRPFPDPDDEARGDGARVRPPVERVSRRSPPWMTYAGRWGRSEEGFVPGEHASPPGPAFQPERWDDPAALAASARPCGAGAPGRWWQWPLVLAAAALLGLLAFGLARGGRALVRATRAAR